MSTLAITDEQITAYFLKELTDKEAERLEERCFAQQEWPADLDVAEQELIDAYLRNELSKDRRARFETNYLTTDARKARVLTSRSLHEILCPGLLPEVTSWTNVKAFWERPVAWSAAVAVLVLAIGIWLVAPFFTQVWQSPSTFRVISLGLSDSDYGNKFPSSTVTVPLATDTLEVHLKLPKQPPDIVGYRIQWQDVNGVLGDLKAKSRDGETLMVLIPAAKLRPGKYVLKLFEIKRDGTEQRVQGSYFLTAEEES